MRSPLAGDEGTYVEERLLIMERHGYPEETYYTLMPEAPAAFCAPILMTRGA